MKDFVNNKERTSEYFQKFDREKTLKLLLSNNKPTIFDVGANVGQSLQEFIDWWPDAIVHCFEPQHECWGSLEAIKDEMGANSIFINREAIGNVSGKKMRFYTHEVSRGISGFSKVNLDSKDSIQIRELQGDRELIDEYSDRFNHERMVSTIRLDDYCLTNCIDKIDILKIDTQGFEPEVLEGLGSRLKSVSIVLTELMLYDYYERRLSFSDIEKHLLPAGFSLYDISHISKNPMNGRTDWVDLIYVKNVSSEGKKIEP